MVNDKILYLVLQRDGRITTADDKDVVGELVRVTRPLGIDLHEYVQDGITATFPNRKENPNARLPQQDA